MGVVIHLVRLIGWNGIVTYRKVCRLVSCVRYRVRIITKNTSL